MSDQNPIPLYAFAMGVVLGLAVGVVFTTAALHDPGPSIDEDPAMVTCAPFVAEDGDADAICFVSGDVDFSWIWNGTSSAGTMSLNQTPANNSTTWVYND